MKRNEKNRRPLLVYVIEEREGADPYWNRIGAAFAHEDGRGYSINLSVLPVNGKLVLREPKATRRRGDEPRCLRAASQHSRPGRLCCGQRRAA